MKDLFKSLIDSGYFDQETILKETELLKKLFYKKRIRKTKLGKILYK